MRFLVFDIKGRFAHFRKFYTNSSSLTYLVPPRTTMEGVVAAILGFERDTYYEDLSSQNLMIAIKKISKTYKIVQTVNYIKATSQSELVSPKEHTQIPFEILTGKESDSVRYRVYATFIDNLDLYNKLKHYLENGISYYPIYLGAASFLAIIEYVGEYESRGCYENYVPISTVIDIDKIESIDFKKSSASSIALVKDRMPYDFDSKRYAKLIKTYFHDENLLPLWVKLNAFGVENTFFIDELAEYITLM